MIYQTENNLVKYIFKLFLFKFQKNKIISKKIFSMQFKLKR